MNILENYDCPHKEVEPLNCGYCSFDLRKNYKDLIIKDIAMFEIEVKKLLGALERLSSN